MTDYLYKFPDEDTARTVLADYYDAETGWKTSGEGYALDVVGILTDTDMTDPENPVSKVLDGWHVNLRIIDDRVVPPLGYVAHPRRPRRVWLGQAVALLACLALSGCLTAAPHANDCLPAAIAAKATLKKNGVPAKVLVVHWDEDGRERGHAYAIFTYGKKFSYDRDFGSIALTAPIAANQNPAYWEAWESNWRRGHRGAIKEAYYLP